MMTQKNFEQEVEAVLYKWQNKLGGSGPVQGLFSLNHGTWAEYALYWPYNQYWSWEGSDYGWEATTAQDYPVMCFLTQSGRLQFGEDFADIDCCGYCIDVQIESAEELDRILELQFLAHEKPCASESLLDSLENPAYQKVLELRQWFEHRFGPTLPQKEGILPYNSASVRTPGSLPKMFCPACGTNILPYDSEKGIMEIHACEHLAFVHTSQENEFLFQSDEFKQKTAGLALSSASAIDFAVNLRQYEYEDFFLCLDLTYCGKEYTDTFGFDLSKGEWE